MADSKRLEDILGTHQPWVRAGDYAFICHANKDKPEIDRLGLIPLVTRQSVHLVIDKDTGFDVGDLPHLVHTFPGGQSWPERIEALARRAGCVLVLWSDNMMRRIQEEDCGGWIGREIMIGLQNNSVFFCCIDGEPSISKISGALAQRLDGFAAFEATIRNLHVKPLGRRALDQGRERIQLDHDMEVLAKEIYETIHSHISARWDNTLDGDRANRLLNLVDREDAAESVIRARAGVLHVISAGRPDRLRDLVQRLTDIDLPWLLRDDRLKSMDLRNWRLSLVNGMARTKWIYTHVNWPSMVRRNGGKDEIDAAVDRGLRSFMEGLVERVVPTPVTGSVDEVVEALGNCLASGADAYLIDSQIARPGPADAELAKRLSVLLHRLPVDKLRVILSTERQAYRPFYQFWHRAPRVFEETAAKNGILLVLAAVRSPELSNWAALAELIVEESRNVIMDRIEEIYAKAPLVDGTPALPMQHVRSRLQEFLAGLPVRPESTGIVKQNRRRAEVM